MSAAVSNSLVVTTNRALSSSGYGADQSTLAFPATLRVLQQQQKKKAAAQLSISAAYREPGGERPNSASIFVGGFVLGGIIVGTLGCVYAPQISKALTGTDRKDLMRKLPKFIYDEEKALEKTRKVLADKIAQLNSAIDDVSSQLRSEDGPNGAASAAAFDEMEASI